MENEGKSKIIKIAMILLVVVLLAAVIGVTLAKYVVSESPDDKANSALWGHIELREHVAELNYETGQYELNKEKWVPISNRSNITSSYNTIDHSMKILKDPYVVLSGTFEVTFKLFVKIVEVRWPAADITYSLTDDWKELPGSRVTDDEGIHTTIIYEYVGAISGLLPPAGGSVNGEMEIPLLLNDGLLVGPSFDADAHKDFGLEFSAWIEQYRE